MSRPKTERNNQIVEMRNAGMKCKDIAEKLGVNDRRVSYIYNREMDRTNGWEKLRNGQTN